MRYYCTEHYLFPGNYPSDGVYHVENYDAPIIVSDIKRLVWACIDYDRVLTQEEVEKWELTPSRMRTYWGSVTVFVDTGAFTTASKEIIIISAAEKPENFSGKNKRTKVCVDWFDSRDKAEEFQSFGY